jgi:ABC-type multidrug transport system ATPase subunit
MNRSASDAHADVAIAFKNLNVKNDRRRTEREWAVQDVTFAALRGKKTLVYGLPVSGKTTLMKALRDPVSNPGRVFVHVTVQEVSLKDSVSWPPKAYAAKYDPELKADTFLIVDDPFDGAVAYLASLDRGMLVFVSVSGQECFHRFDRLIYLRDGRVAFDGTPKAFFQWVRDTRPPELRYKLDDTVVETGGAMPGCPELDK